MLHRCVVFTIRSDTSTVSALGKHYSFSIYILLVWDQSLHLSPVIIVRW